MRKRFHYASMETVKGKRVSIMELREKIIEEAEQLYREYGLKFTLQDIAARLHIAKKTIYRFYPSKDDLCAAVIDHAFEKIQAAKSRILADETLSLKEKAERVLIAMPDTYAGMDLRSLTDLPQQYPKAASALQKHLQSDWDPVIALLEEGRREGVFRKVSYPVLRTMIASAITSFMESDVLEKESVSYSEGLREMMVILMKGIAYDKDDQN